MAQPADLSSENMISHKHAGHCHSIRQRLTANTIIPHRFLLQTGIWPSRTAGNNLQNKFSHYKGDTALYQRNALKRRPYYATNPPEAQAEPASKSVMTEKPFGGQIQPTPCWAEAH